MYIDLYARGKRILRGQRDFIWANLRVSSLLDWCCAAAEPEGHIPVQAWYNAPRFFRVRKTAPMPYERQRGDAP